jgi:hypothetical protein
MRSLGVRRLLVGLPVGAAVVIAAVVAVQPLAARPAAAAGGQYCYLAGGSSSDGAVGYEVKCVQAASGGSAGRGGSSAEIVDTCKLADWQRVHLRVRPDDDWPLYCDGDDLCMLRPPVEDREAAAELAAQLEPGSGGTVVERFCIYNNASGRPFDEGWTYFIGGVPPGPGMAARMLEAYGNLAAPAAQIGHSPNVDAVVNLDSWFWLAGAPFAEFDGTPAFSVVAVGEPVDITWTYGDGGSDVDVCPVNGQPQVKSCASHVYPRSSGSEPTDAFRVTAVRHYTVRYEMFGLPLVIPPGVPTAFDAAPVAIDLGVVETQVTTD